MAMALDDVPPLESWWLAAGPAMHSYDILVNRS
jgi:hypothetical protein